VPGGQVDDLLIDVLGVLALGKDGVDREVTVVARHQVDGDARALEAFRRHECEVLAADVAERRPAPELECVRPAFLRYELLERIRVELPRLDPQHVAARARLDPLVTQCAPELRDVHLQRLHRRRGRRLRPELVDQHILRDHAVSVEKEQQEQGARLRRLERNAAAVVVDDLERSEDAELHRSGAYAVG